MKKLYQLILSTILSLPLLGGVGGGLLLTSCSENVEEVEEYVDWQNTNETEFAALYAQAKAGQNSLKVIRNWSMPTDENANGYTEKAADCIVVKVLEEGNGNGTPIFTDTVRCHYEGRLLPSTTHKDGLVFDKSWYGQFSLDTATPSKFAVNGLVDGFATALQNMHSGDHWLVYMPYQLGYGSSGSGSKIPGYSTLIFDIRLVDYWSPKK